MAGKAENRKHVRDKQEEECFEGGGIVLSIRSLKQKTFAAVIECGRLHHELHEPYG